MEANGSHSTRVTCNLTFVKESRLNLLDAKKILPAHMASMRLPERYNAIVVLEKTGRRQNTEIPQIIRERKMEGMEGGAFSERYHR